MKKIAVFNMNFFPISETFIFRQVVGLSKVNSVDLISFDFVNEDKFVIPNIKIPIKRYYGPFDKIVSVVVKRLRNDPYSLGLSASALIKKHLINNKYDVIHAHFGYSGLFILPIAKALNIPLVVSFHGIDASPAYLKDIRYKKKLIKLFDYSAAIIIVSPHMIDTLHLDKWRTKIKLIPYGVDQHEFTNSKSNDRKEASEIRILHSGRLVGKKGVPDLILVFYQLAETYSNISLDILGDGPDLIQCQTLIENSPYGAKVRLLGAQTQKEVKRAFENSDIFVLNSRTDDAGDMEGLPNAILEAMSMQLCVISTYHAGIPQAIDSDYNGLLVPEKDNSALYLALEKVITNDILRARLAKAARATIENQFTLDVMQNHVNEAFEYL